MAVEIKYQADETKLRKLASEAIAQSIIDARHQPVLLLLSGGSCLKLLPDLHHRLFDQTIRFFHLTIGMVDERFDEQQSNFVTMERDYSRFGETAVRAGVTFIDTSPKLKDQYKMADWYEQKLSTLSSQPSALNGKIIILLGMGSDGHIAGILPYPDSEQQVFYETFLDTERMVVGYDATGKNQFTKRFTLTFPGLFLADRVVAFITGTEKQAPLELALHGQPPLHRCPAHYLSLSSQKIDIFTTCRIKERK